MPGRIVELTTDGARLGVERGFLTVASSTTLGRVALDDVEAVLASVLRP